MVQRCRALAQGRGPADQLLLDGAHLIAEALDAGVTIDSVLADERMAGLAARAATRGAVVFETTAEVVNAASPVQHASGIVAIARWIPARAADLVAQATGPVVALVDVQDPGNVGSIMRSADALGASAVLALDATASPAGWKALRAAMGSTFRIPIGTGRSADVLDAARHRGVAVVATVVTGGVRLYDWVADTVFILVVGNEGSGLPQPIATAADVRVTIPMRPGIDSLNVGISTALVLSEAARQRGTRSL